MNTQQENIIIVGAGLVGTVLAMYLSRRGYRVRVYDQHPDLTALAPVSRKSSLNLTLCERGLKPLDAIGVGPLVRAVTTPVYGRMIHTSDGHLAFQHYGTSNQALYSIFRSDLNKILIDYARHNFDVAFHFEQKCTDIQLGSTTIAFKDLRSGQIRPVSADRIFGADGSFSSVRWQLQKLDRFNYSQQYMEYGYREITIQHPASHGWIAEKHVIHFWPRDYYMLMGFSNIDGSFTLSLHLPLHGPCSFESIQTDADLLQLFQQSFPDVLAQIDDLPAIYFNNVTNSMITVRCHPWSFQDTVALIGDAAHAIVPYYGQGANAGFEDCATLDQCIEQYAGDWHRIFSEYEQLRKPSTDAIAELALQNFVELRALVGDPKFLLRKEIERRIHLMYPDRYVSLYSMIAFSSLPYVEAVRLDQERRARIDAIMSVAGIEHMSEPERDLLIDEAMGQTLLPLMP